MKSNDGCLGLGFKIFGAIIVLYLMSYAGYYSKSWTYKNVYGLSSEDEVKELKLKIESLEARMQKLEGK